jgi:hypothetical protein
MLSLRDNFNEEEVLHFVRWVGERLFTYQFGHFYEFIPTIMKTSISSNSEYLKDFENRINNSTESFHRFECAIACDIDNTIPQVNNGEEKVSPDWRLHFNFINLLNLPKVCVVNTDDIPFETPGAAIYLRSVLAELIREYGSKHFKELFRRNFEVIACNDPRYEASARELIAKVQDLSLTREQTQDLLKNMKCRLTGTSFSEIGKKDFTITK